MISLEETEIILNEIAVEFPHEIFIELNGGIILLPEAKLNTVGKKKDLYILGEYHNGGDMNRYIVIYYGSFLHVYGHLDRKHMKKHLIQTLKHEFTHHLESLAGERDLEIKDAEYIADYLGRKHR